MITKVKTEPGISGKGIEPSAKLRSVRDWLFITAAHLCMVLVSLCLAAEASAAPCDTKSGYAFVRHDTDNSNCELCGVGYVTVIITNPYRYTSVDQPTGPDIQVPGAAMADIVLIEDLGSSGLEYAGFATQPISYRVNGGGWVYPGGSPTVSGSTLVFDQSLIPALAELESNPSNISVNTITIRFAVSRVSDPEGLVSASRNIQAQLSFDTVDEDGNALFCGDSPQTDTDILDLLEPVPQVVKNGWNYDAGQRQGTASEPVFGTNDDDVVWQLRINNTGDAGLQDLRFSDVMETGSMDIDYYCPTVEAANTIASSHGATVPSSCSAVSGNSLIDEVVTYPFGDHGSVYDGYTNQTYEVDIEARGRTDLFLVGTIRSAAACNLSTTNTVSDIVWGCEAQGSGGGEISQSSTMTAVTSDSATLFTRYGDINSSLTIDRQLTGTNTSQPVGSKGTMTITITNNTGGSVRNIELIDVLPAEYVVDYTYTPEIDVDPAYGNDYTGMIDRISWDNEQADPLNNTAPHFTLSSSTADGAYVNMLRHGDRAVVTFRVVLIDSTYYDRTANLDINPESYVLSNPTDPEPVPDLSNELTVTYDLFCASQTSANLVLTGNGTAISGNSIPADPEDLDVDITEDVFILTDDINQTLTLPIEVTNNGGHDAADYHVFVSFGTTMDVVDAPSGCNPISLDGSNQPSPWQVWVETTTIPASASVYHCSMADQSDVIAPGQTVAYAFDVVKTEQVARILEDDLSLRADVIGEITLSDGTLLTFPDMIARDDGVTDRANNYTVDTTWARVVGFNLKKSQVGECSENPPATYDSGNYEEVQVGEECTYHIETGGWFGFETPGFSYIAVRNIDVVDDIPDGQAYVSNTDWSITSSPQIQGVSRHPGGLSAWTEVSDFGWLFNELDTQRIEDIDVWFIVDTTTRLLNAAENDRAQPNVHGANSYNVLTSTFDGIFSNANTGAVESYTLGPSTVGFPNQAIRRVDLTVTEPRLILEKEVCNETLYGAGPSCSNFVAVADDGDAYDKYIYRITVTNEETSDGVQRAPAYDVVVTDVLDSTNLGYIEALASDGLDNDGDGSSDGGDPAGEGTASNYVAGAVDTDNVVFSYLHSSALEKIEAGQSVNLYYRVDYDDTAAPLQTFTNTVTASYDSLAGDSGSQSLAPGATGERGGARLYSTTVDESARASVRIIPVATRPKAITAMANTALTGSGTQTASIGEELEYELHVLLPVAQLRNFVIYDDLPEGLSCSDAPDVNLDAAPYSEAGFQPGGIITPTCTDDMVSWDFGDQYLTNGSTFTRYDMAVSFIAQVENSALTNDGGTLTNGDPTTEVRASYIDESGTAINTVISEVSVQLLEPSVELTTGFNVTEADAGDIVTVTVSAINNGTAPAYNLRVLNDLDATRFTYIGNEGGANPPDLVDTAILGPNQPVFSWNLPNEIAPGGSVSFSYQVQLADDVQVQEILGNTIEAAWTSLPEQNTALNSSGIIGADGSVDGMRNGTLPNSGDAVNDYETVASAQLNVPAALIAKSDTNSSIVPAIGAHKLFSLEVTFPEGLTTDVRIDDYLDAAGISYVLVDKPGYPISYSFSGIESINGAAPAVSVLNSIPSDESTGMVSWDIGTVVTEREDDLSASVVTPTIRIDYYARINNGLDTDAGDSIQNGVELTYLNAGTGTTENVQDAADAVTVSEPDLLLQKTVANVTVGKVVTDQPVAGDTLEYQLTLTNNGSTNATAYDINIVDTLPDGVELDTGFTPTATISGTSVSGFVGIPSGGTTGTIVWGKDNADNSLDLPYGQSLVITYRTTVVVVSDPSGLIENGVYGDWTSLQQDSPYERTGEGCPAITEPDDYCVGPVTATVYGIAPVLDFQKTAVDIDDGSTIVSSASPGDVLRYHVTVNNTASAQAQFTLRDEIDQLNSSAWFVPGSLTLISTPAGISADSTGGSAGTGLIGSSNMILDGNETLSFDFTVQLVDIIPGGTEVLNQAQLDLVGFGVAGSDDPNLAGDVNPTVVTIDSAPLWQFEKTSQDITGASSVLLPGDQLRYTIMVRNIGSEDAENVILTDAIPANTTYIAGSTTLNGAAVADPSAGVSPLEGGMSIHAVAAADAGAMPADPAAGNDSLATVTFTVQVDETVAGGTEITNQASLDGSGTGSGVFAEQLSDDPATTASQDPTIDVVSGMTFVKSVENMTTGGDGSTATPGDILRYTLSLTNTSTVDLSDLAVSDELESLQPDPPLLFVPGTLSVESLPSGADTTGTDAAGGSKGTGIVRIGNLNAAAGETITMSFTVQLASVITNGKEILNQAEISAEGVVLQLSDSPDSSLAGDSDPTVTVIESAPEFEVKKTAAFLEGDPDVLLAGERLRFTITVKNVGTENAVDAVLQDYVPANTSYIADSTTLNGSAVADAGGIPPLRDGLVIKSPDSSADGAMTADSSSSTDNVASITFDVIVDEDAMDGLIIENQAFLSASGAGSGALPEQPSDDPATAAVDDPTRVVVGNVPLLYALKTGQLAVDNNGNGLVNPGDIVEYRITVNNTGGADAGNAALTDAVPTNMSYVADSLFLNGAAYGADGGVFPLASGLTVQSSDNPGIGVISAGESVVLSYRMQVDAGVVEGTQILNQATLSCDEVNDLLTDSDGLADNGYQETVIVIGAAQLLQISKNVAVVDGTSAEAGSELSYTILVTNIGSLPATDVLVTDDLTSLTGLVTFVAGSGELSGLASGISYASGILTADYSAMYGPLAPGDSFTVRFNVTVSATATAGTPITNTAVVTWDNPRQTEAGSVALDVGGTPGSAALNGMIWHDADLDLGYDAAREDAQADWTVELFLDSTLITSTTSDSDGLYHFSGLVPSSGSGSLYEVRFTAPGAGPNTASLGLADSTFNNGPQRISGISVEDGGNLQNLNMPLSPNGTVYNSVVRSPVRGASVALVNATTGTTLPGSCFDDPLQQNQITANNGFYKFDLNFSSASCPDGGTYLIETVPPASGYTETPSVLIPPARDNDTDAFSVPDCPGSGYDAIPATADYCEAVSDHGVPALAYTAGSAETVYYLHLTLAGADIPGDSQIFNNQLPIDPSLSSAVALTKVAGLRSVTKGSLVPYTITLTNTFGAALSDISIVDRFPAGFKYVAGSARLDGVSAEPDVNGRELTWDGLALGSEGAHTIKLLLVVGAGVSEGEYVNRAQAYNTILQSPISGEASATVNVVPDPDFDCSDVIGKVFDDRNLNGYQDADEPGLAGARVATARGLVATTDQYGRYHVTCAVVPDEDRGSNFIMKLDDRSLPTGYRVISENPRVQRATRGKMLRFNFAAALHRVVTMDIADAVFEAGTVQLRPQWRQRVDSLLDILAESPSILRLSYLGDLEDSSLVDHRLEHLKEILRKRWKTESGNYRLTIETEIFWRRGSPMK